MRIYMKLLLAAALLGFVVPTMANKEQRFDPLQQFNQDKTSYTSKTIDDIIPYLPDACSLEPHDGELIEEFLIVPGYENYYQLRVVAEESFWPKAGQPIELALIVNGNGYSREAYDSIADFLARNGFVVGAVTRPGDSGGNTDPQFIIDTLDTIYDFFQLRPNISITLIGHSKGGRVVNNAAILNTDQGLGYPIDAVINVAPNSKNSGKLNGADTAAFLALYGSRDRDMSGNTNAMPQEAFKAYDETGTEGSTVCDGPDCFLWSPLIDKSMAYLYGADHAEMMGTETKHYNHNITSYLSFEDQSCIGRAYINAFMRWHIRGEEIYKGFIRGQWAPLSIDNMTTNKADGLGHPAGIKARVYHQFSPLYKQSIENWEDGSYNVAYKSPSIQTSLIDKHDESFYGFAKYKHWTNSALVGWKNKNHFQYWGLKVPIDVQNADGFSHFSFRAGQLKTAELVSEEFQNQGKDHVLWVGLRDALGQFAWKQLSEKSLPWVDRHSAMSTIIIPMDDFNGINHSSIEQVYFAFPPSSQGSLMFDNIEWIKY